MVGLPKYENIFTRFDTIHERDRQTDTTRRHKQCRAAIL